jgi:hypothetical protein
MSTSTNPNSQPVTTNRVNAFQALIHLPRMFKVAGNVLQDSRVNILPKIGFVGGIFALILALLAPETLAQVVDLIPGLGPLLGALEIPVDGAIDWLALGLAAFNLLKLFPQDVVNEHYDRATGRPTTPLTTGPVVDADPPTH